MDKEERARLMYVWSDMKRRCHNPRHHAYKNYGGRGIYVCSRWRESLSAFLEDMGPRPSREHSIDRVDNDNGYSPENCVWATRQEQNLNKRDYKNNSSGHRNIAREAKVARGREYLYWRVRVRRGGKVVTHSRFHELKEAIAHRDKIEGEYSHARA